LITFHLWSRSPKKSWPPDLAAQVANSLAAMFNARIALLGGRAEARLAEQAAQLMDEPPLVFTGGGTGLTEIAAILEASTLIVGNDSGPTHMAAALKRPVVVLFGGSNPRVWHPWNTPHVLLNQRQPCAPCRGPDPCYREFACIRDITPRQVIAAAQSLLSEHANESANGR